MRAEVEPVSQKQQDEDPPAGWLVRWLRHASFVLTLGLVAVIILLPGGDSVHDFIAYVLGVFAGEIEEVVGG